MVGRWLLLLRASRAILQGRPRRMSWPWEIRESDIYLVSFPRSGNTWVGRMIAMLREPGSDLSPRSVRRYYCDPYFIPSALGEMTAPRVIKSHSPSDPGFPRVIYLVRDGRDALVSYHDFAVRGGSTLSFEQFVRSQTMGLGPFGSWAAHVGNWMLGRGRSPELLLRYEDAWTNPHRSVTQLAHHLGMEPGDAAIDRCVNAVADHFRAATRRREGRRDARHRAIGLARGPGAWREYFSRELEEFFWQRSAVEMEAMGYSRSAHSSSSGAAPLRRS